MRKGGKGCVSTSAWVTGTDQLMQGCASLFGAGARGVTGGGYRLNKSKCCELGCVTNRYHGRVCVFGRKQVTSGVCRACPPAWVVLAIHMHVCMQGLPQAIHVNRTSLGRHDREQAEHTVEGIRRVMDLSLYIQRLANVIGDRHRCCAAFGVGGRR